MKCFSIVIMRILFGLLAIPMPHNAYAQEQPNSPATKLVITLHDANGNGIAQAELLVLDAQGTTVAQAFTDQTGSAIIPGVIADEVRLVVRGMLADGTQLVQTGFDAEGMLLFVAGPGLQIDLLAEPHGAVVPDPVTMLSPDPPIDAFPVLLPTIKPDQTSIGIQAAQTPVPPRQQIPWLAIGLLGFAVAIGLVVFRPSERR
jgi:hypothetical protein